MPSGPQLLRRSLFKKKLVSETENVGHKACTVPRMSSLTTIELSWKLDAKKELSCSSEKVHWGVFRWENLPTVRIDFHASLGFLVSKVERRNRDFNSFVWDITCFLSLRYLALCPLVKALSRSSIKILREGLNQTGSVERKRTVRDGNTALKTEYRQFKRS